MRQALARVEQESRRTQAYLQQFAHCINDVCGQLQHLLRAGVQRTSPPLGQRASRKPVRLKRRRKTGESKSRSKGQSVQTETVCSKSKGSTAKPIRTRSLSCRDIKQKPVSPKDSTPDFKARPAKQKKTKISAFQLNSAEVHIPNVQKLVSQDFSEWQRRAQALIDLQNSQLSNEDSLNDAGFKKANCIREKKARLKGRLKQLRQKKGKLLCSDHRPNGLFTPEQRREIKRIERGLEFGRKEVQINQKGEVNGRKRAREARLNPEQQQLIARKSNQIYNQIVKIENQFKKDKKMRSGREPDLKWPQQRKKVDREQKGKLKQGNCIIQQKKNRVLKKKYQYCDAIKGKQPIRKVVEGGLSQVRSKLLAESRAAAGQAEVIIQKERESLKLAKQRIHEFLESRNEGAVEQIKARLAEGSRVLAQMQQASLEQGCQSPREREGQSEHAIARGFTSLLRSIDSAECVDYQQIGRMKRPLIFKQQPRDTPRKDTPYPKGDAGRLCPGEAARLTMDRQPGQGHRKSNCLGSIEGIVAEDAVVVVPPQYEQGMSREDVSEWIKYRQLIDEQIRSIGEDSEDEGQSEQAALASEGRASSKVETVSEVREPALEVQKEEDLLQAISDINFENNDSCCFVLNHKELSLILVDVCEKKLESPEFRLQLRRLAGRDCRDCPQLVTEDELLQATDRPEKQQQIRELNLARHLFNEALGRQASLQNVVQMVNIERIMGSAIRYVEEAYQDVDCPLSPDQKLRRLQLGQVRLLRARVRQMGNWILLRVEEWVEGRLVQQVQDQLVRVSSARTIG